MVSSSSSSSSSFQPMAVEAANPALSIPSHCTVLTVGNNHVARAILQLAQQHFPELVPTIQNYHRSKDNRGTFFLRDYAVLRPKDRVLVAPYAIQHGNLPEIFRTLVLFPRIDVASFNQAAYGIGFDPKFQACLKKDCALEDFPLLLGKTCVEGGNVSLFKGADGIICGIIGEYSVVLSLIALTEQGYFEKNAGLLQIVRDSIGQVPSDNYLQLARYIERISDRHPDFSSPTDFFNSLSNHLFFEFTPLERIFELLPGEKESYYPLMPLSAEERIDYRETALELQARFTLTLMTLATELGVLVKNLAVFKQILFHIDLELAVDTRKGIVYVQGNRQTIQALDDAMPDDPEPAQPLTAPRCVLLPPKTEEDEEEYPLPYLLANAPSSIIVEDEDDVLPPPTQIPLHRKCESAIFNCEERWKTNIQSLCTRYKVMSLSYDLLLRTQIEPKALAKRKMDLIQFEATHERCLRLFRHCDFVLEMGSPYEEENRRAIERATGMKVVFVPGSYEVLENVSDGSKKPTRMNFLNGVFLHGQNSSIFVTNGGDPRLEAAFEAAVRKADPDLHIEFIPGMDKMLTEKEGGVHCIVRETPS